DDGYLVNRWQNLLSFDYTYTETYQTDGEFFIYPEDETGYRFPNPDKYSLFKNINDAIQFRNQTYGTNLPLIDLGNPEDDSDNGDIGTFSPSDIVIPSTPGFEAITMLDYIKFGIHNAFTPLTEVPILYNYIKPDSYQPIPKKQVIRDGNG